jgi:hypothetical protein
MITNALPSKIRLADGSTFGLGFAIRSDAAWSTVPGSVGIRAVRSSATALTRRCAGAQSWALADKRSSDQLTESERGDAR